MQKKYFNKPAMILAHRGMPEELPENTMPSFKKAYDLGVDVIETDVHFTRDKKFVIIHDPKLDRTTDGSGKVIEYTEDELKKLDAGYYFTGDNEKTYPFRGIGITLPSLEEILTEFPDMRFNIDLKDNLPHQVSCYYEIIKECKASERVLTASSHNANLQILRKIAPEMVTSFSTIEILKFLLFSKTGQKELMSGFKGDALQLPAYLCRTGLITESLIKQAHNMGYKIDIWTVNRKEEMKKMIEIGVDGIFTNYPEVLKDALNEK